MKTLLRSSRRLTSGPENALDLKRQISYSYENYIDFLNGKDTNLISKNIDWGDWWFKKSTTRYKKLDKDNQLASEILFHERIPEDEIEMWLSAAGKN